MHRLHKSYFTPMPRHRHTHHTHTANPRRHRMAVKSKGEARGYVFKESDLQWRASQQSPRSLHTCTGTWTFLDLQSQKDAGDRLAKSLSIDAGSAIQWFCKERLAAKDWAAAKASADQHRAHAIAASVSPGAARARLRVSSLTNSAAPDPQCRGRPRGTDCLVRSSSG